MLFLTKLLSLIVYPLGAAILVGATAFILTFTRWRRLAQVLLGLALAILWIAATPLFANWLDVRLESRVPHVSLRTLPQSDAVIVLGGATDSRIMYAWRIYGAGKAPVILISGGHLPWETVVPEARRMAEILVELGVPRSALILETGSRTTRENAVNTAALFKEHGWRNGLLVTSGYHMPRALAAFKKVGLNVTPAAPDINSEPIKFDSLLDLLPNAWALSWTTSTIKEMIGLCVYRYRGWA